MGNIWAYTNSSTKTHRAGRDGNQNNQSTSAVTTAWQEMFFFSKALRCCQEYGLGAQPPDKGLCMDPDAPLAHLKGLFMAKVCVCIYTCKKPKT